MNRLLYRLLLFMMPVLAACSTSGRLAITNLSDAYRISEQNPLNLSWRFYHPNDSVTRLYYAFSNDLLLYQKPVGRIDYSARYRVDYRLYDGWKGAQIVDSGYVTRIDSFYYQQKFSFFEAIDLEALSGYHYVLEWRLTDQNRKKQYVRLMELDRTQKGAAADYLLFDQQDKMLFKNYFSGREAFQIQCNNPNCDTLAVRYYNRSYPIARPPFDESGQETFSFQPDSLFLLRTIDGQSSPINWERPGLYHIQYDTAKKAGLTLFRYSKDFPKIKTAEDMLGPMRYITSLKEFKRLREHPNTKLVIDSLWLNMAGNPDRAAQRIRDYYSHVQDANRLFSSYHEGWKTDRGMIYIVFGPPDIVYRNEGVEEWTYGETGNLSSFRFTFAKIRNPFTDNDYALLRSPLLKEIWYIAVESWRR